MLNIHIVNGTVKSQKKTMLNIHFVNEQIKSNKKNNARNTLRK